MVHRQAIQQTSNLNVELAFDDGDVNVLGQCQRPQLGLQVRDPISPFLDEDEGHLDMCHLRQTSMG